MSPSERGATSGEKGTVDDDRVGRLIKDALARTKTTKRSPLEVTADRVADALDKYADRLSGAQRDEFSAVIYMLESLAEGVDP